MSVTELRPSDVSDDPVVEQTSTGMLPLPGPLRFRAGAVRVVGGLTFVALFLTLPRVLERAGPAYAIDFGLIVALAVLSASVVAWVGEISLATLAQMGMGVVMLNALQDHGVPFALVLVVVALSSIPVSLLIGFFALRLRGVNFAIATLAFAYLAQKTFFQSYLGAEGGFEKPLTRPDIVSSDTRLYYLIAGFTLLVAGICYVIRKSWIGTRIDALRDSEMAFAVLGHSPARYKLFTICLAGMIATVAGTFYGILQQVVPANYFNPILAIAYFAYAVVGGLGSIGGAIAAGLVFGAVPKYFDAASQGRFVGYDQFFAGLVALCVILIIPGGLAEIGQRIRRRAEGRAR
jgi:ABC-type branched-subunit amino acid transport system permease subunit